ncbi:SEC-C motif-containing protein [Nocardia transvalensis]|uniref:SEC-C motif-containing protein n=1 Tax=Nocardia transvalensis TaxID=37333 RepID=A0A7W9PAC2_9NOCA|nr:YchJ family metal-binding protein [Nocardia transvalensis]MBB5912365.1 SEC-C motif-containing protein [Nocardia transvalensis]
MPERPADTAPCPCRSGETFAGCCGPRLDGTGPAPTAAALMRSRFTAFAVGDAGYLLRSWHPRTRPRTLTLDPEQRWLYLEIARTERGGPFDTTGVVEFRAHYRSDGRRGVLHECSEFARVDNAWAYVEGDIEL